MSSSYNEFEAEKTKSRPGDSECLREFNIDVTLREIDSKHHHLKD
jgi:hypothetical protein